MATKKVVIKTIETRDGQVEPAQNSVDLWDSTNHVITCFFILFFLQVINESTQNHDEME